MLINDKYGDEVFRFGDVWLNYGNISEKYGERMFEFGDGLDCF